MAIADYIINPEHVQLIMTSAMRVVQLAIGVNFAVKQPTHQVEDEVEIEVHPEAGTSRAHVVGDVRVNNTTPHLMKSTSTNTLVMKTNSMNIML